MKYTHLSLDKTKHSVAVAAYMAENAKKYGLDSAEMFVVGLLHDVGYLDGKESHELKGAALLADMGLKPVYVDAIMLHGKNLEEVDNGKISSAHGVSPVLRLLCEADLSVDKFGHTVGFKKRLQDIKDRYGENSIAYETAKNTVSFLKSLNDKEMVLEEEQERS